MRVIKFRGKKVSDGQWVEGLVYNVSHYGKILTYIQTGEYAVKNGSIYGEEVIPETVGQFTGLTDKNGKEVWEGDKLLFSGLVEWQQEQDNEYSNYRCGFDFTMGSVEEDKVIGNIHENKEGEM